MSRKKQVYEKITALYCRISLDDGGDNESMSISNHGSLAEGSRYAGDHTGL